MSVGHRLTRLAADLDELAMRLELRARALDGKEARRVARELRDLRRDLESPPADSADTAVMTVGEVEP